MAYPDDAHSGDLPTAPGGLGVPSPRIGPVGQPDALVPDDWPRQATETIVRTVDTVRDKTTGPIITAANIVVYALIGFVAAGMLAVFALIGIGRLIDAATGGRMWIGYVAFGVLFVIAGSVCWRKRHPVPLD